MLRAALRRFGTLLVATGLGAALLGLAIAGLTHQSALRGLAVGFYVAGVGLCALAFLLGSRPPVRGKGDGGFVFSRWMGGGVRFATRDEQDEALNLPAIFAVLGVLLLLAGVLVDPSRPLL